MKTGKKVAVIILLVLSALTLGFTASITVSVLIDLAENSLAALGLILFLPILLITALVTVVLSAIALGLSASSIKRVTFKEMLDGDTLVDDQSKLTGIEPVKKSTFPVVTTVISALFVLLTLALVVAFFVILG